MRTELSEDQINGLVLRHYATGKPCSVLSLPAIQKAKEVLFKQDLISIDRDGKITVTKRGMELLDGKLYSHNVRNMEGKL